MTVGVPLFYDSVDTVHSLTDGVPVIFTVLSGVNSVTVGVPVFYDSVVVSPPPDCFCSGIL